MILGAVGCDQHHRLVRPEQATWVCKPRGPQFFARYRRRSSPAGRRSLPAKRRPQSYEARRPTLDARRLALVACRRAPRRPTPLLAAQRIVARRAWVVARGSRLVVHHPLSVDRRPLFVDRCSLSAGPSFAPECTQLSPVASSLWGLTACRCAAAARQVGVHRVGWGRSAPSACWAVCD